MKTKKLTFHADPGHGWLEVEFSDLVELDIENKISPYSYARLDRVYLEEDCDAHLFMETAKQNGWIINIQEKYQENTPIRNYPSYSTPRLLGA